MNLDLLTALRLSASGMQAQRTRLGVLASNLANANSTRSAENGGKAYQRKDPIFQTVSADSFDKTLDKEARKAAGVEVTEIVTDQRPGPRVYDPSHPDAGPDGYVQMPNVNTVTELTDIMATSRSYEANVSAVRTIKDMINAALGIGKAS